MHRIKVGVLRGGVSSEYDVSLNSGAAVLRNMPEKYEAVDLLIDKKGVWHFAGLPYAAEDILKHVDVVFNALHGYYGEDGKVQQFLDAHSMPYTGSGALGSAIGMNKNLAKNYFKAAGIKTPESTMLSRSDDEEEDIARNWEQEIKDLYKNFPQPSVIKPVFGGSSVGTSIAHDFPSFFAGIVRAFGVSNAVLIEEYIAGREATQGVIDHFRDERYYALPAIEIIAPKSKAFFDYEAKYTGISQEICPAYFEDEIKDALREYAVAAHQALDLKGYSRSDFIVSDDGIYILEVNTLPGLTEESLVPKALAAVGCKFPDFIDHLITLSLKPKR